MLRPPLVKLYRRLPRDSQSASPNGVTARWRRSSAAVASLTAACRSVMGAGCWSWLRSARRIEDRIAAAAGDFEVVIQVGAGCRRST